MLAVINRAPREDHLSNSEARNTGSFRMKEDYPLQVSEQVEDRVSKKLSQELNRTGSHFLGALSKLYDFLLNPPARMTPKMFRRHPGIQPEKIR